MKCPICNNNIGILRNRLSLDGVLCKDCSDKIIEETYSKYSNKRCRKCFHKTKYYEDLDKHKCDNCKIIYSLEEAKEMTEYGLIDDSFNFIVKWSFITFLCLISLLVLLELSELGWIGAIFILLLIFAFSYSSLDK